MNIMYLLNIFFKMCLISFFIFFKNISLANLDSNIYLPSLAPMLKKVLPTVVNIYVEGFQQNKHIILPKEFKYFFGPDFPNESKKQFEGLGSGVIIDSNQGYIITNNHVINGADKIKVQLNDGREFYAKLIGFDEQTDLALIKILTYSKGLKAIKIADSDYLQVGDFALAIGNPFGLGQTVTSGIISALGRSGLNLEGLENFIQTDASINKGNSGGALININGELIGINTAILAPGGGNIGIGFAIPSNIVKNLSQQFIKFGKVKHSQLGIKGTELNADIAKAFNINIQKGAFVSEVLLDSAAYKAGIKAGDIIVSFNEKQINSFAELRVKIGTTIPGTLIKLGLLRNGKLQEIPVILSDINRNNEEITIPSLEGAILKNSNLLDGTKCVKVVDVIKGSLAHSIGLQKGDMIICLNKERIENVSQLKKFLENKLNVIALLIKRGNANIYLILQ